MSDQPRTILAALRGITEVIDSAHSAGLPLPTSVTTNIYLPTIQVQTAQDWEAWRAYLTADGDPFTIELSPDGRQLWATGEALDLRIAVVHVDGEGQDGHARAHYDRLVARGLAHTPADA